MDMTSIIGLAAFVAICFAAATSGAIFRPGAWYAALRKPPWNPPNWVFPPAWSILYILIAISGWLVWREAGVTGAAVPLTVYVVNLALNALWSAVFFGLRRPDWAFVEVLFLWSSILYLVLAFHPISPTASYLMVPYLLWVTFAAGLNLAIWRRNSDEIGSFLKI